jgi:hypothetical protein
MSQPLNIIIVEKTGILKSLAIKDFKIEDLYKKCGFKKSDDFVQQVEWNVKYDNKKYIIEVYAKTEGRSEPNKYDFPPPIDKVLFFGNCAILAFLKKEDGTKTYTDITLPLWNKIYEKLFGGFEDLAATAAEDEEEEDELANIPKEKKTKQGYLKDGFVVDSSDTEDTSSNHQNDEDEEEELYEEEDDELDEEDDNIIIEDLGSELSEESYDYDSEE